MLLFQDACGESRGVVVFTHLDDALDDDRAGVEVLVDEVHGAAGDFHAVGERLRLRIDAGPIIVQRSVEVRDDDTAATLSARILEQEHTAYVEALEKLSTKEWRVEGRRVVFGPNVSRGHPSP